MADPVLINRYQLENLQKNRVQFIFVDLSEGQVEGPAQTLLSGSHKVTASGALDFLRQRNAGLDAPIVLICETGTISVAVARKLEENFFINVFVIDGGIEGLKFHDA